MTREKAIEMFNILPLCNECDSSNFPYTCAECGDAFLLAMEALKQPEVVRCKDCKHWWYGNYCDKHGKGQENADWFCADGEKNDE